MRHKRANIDSLNLKSDHLETIFIHNEDYRIQTVKNKVKPIRDPQVWRKTFGKPLANKVNGVWVSPIIEAKIIHTYRGVTLPLKTFAKSPLSQTLEFAGLHGYNSRSEELLIALNEIKSQLQYTSIARIDIAIDYEKEIPRRIIKKLLKTRKPFDNEGSMNTTYYKTPKEFDQKKKSNPYMDIKIYNKQIQAGLDYPIHRLEFVFKGRYFGGLQLKDLDLAIEKMEKSIKRTIGLTVKIESI